MSHQEIIDRLNLAVQMELSATHQYQLHAHVLDDWGLSKLSAQMREEMQEETGHCDRFIQRILFLKGDPKITLMKPPQRATSLVDLFKIDLRDEEETISEYSMAAKAAWEARDVGTRVLFEEILLDEERHKSWLELQLELINRIGDKAYSAKLVTVVAESLG